MMHRSAQNCAPFCHRLTKPSLAYGQLPKLPLERRRMKSRRKEIPIRKLYENTASASQQHTLKILAEVDPKEPGLPCREKQDKLFRQRMLEQKIWFQMTPTV